MEYLNHYDGALRVNGVRYSAVKSVPWETFNGQIEIDLYPDAEEEKEIYEIEVKVYMTRPATPQFDLMDKWNNGIPMPLTTMTGYKISETKGMVQMDLWSDVEDASSNQLKWKGWIPKSAIIRWSDPL